MLTIAWPCSSRWPARWAMARTSSAPKALRSRIPVSGPTSSESSARELARTPHPGRVPANNGRALAMSRRWAWLLGQPVAHSLSPALHNAAFAAMGIDAHYEARDVARADLSAAVEALRAADCLGANVTAPYKQAVLSLMDD